VLKLVLEAVKQTRLPSADRQVLDVAACEADEVREIHGPDGVLSLEMARLVSVLKLVHVDVAALLKTQYGTPVNRADLDVERLRHVRVLAKPGVKYKCICILEMLQRAMLNDVLPRVFENGNSSRSEQ